MGAPSQAIAKSFQKASQMAGNTSVQPTSSSSKGKGSVSTPPPQVIEPPVYNPMGLNRNITIPGQDGQPAMGAPNPYANTIVSSDNQYNSRSSGKGKGG